jgi:two-component system, chemotaxis family, protein-glutamate methylesterase/glutaminase
VIKVLVVDDSALMRRVLTGILVAAGDFEVAVARDGAEALARLADYQPDVITLDVNMPGMDGLACLDRIMVQRPCPVVMVSSLTAAGADVTLSALQLGAVDFIAKPSGTVSLAADELAPSLVEKVRNASRARVRGTLRLTERIRLRAAAAVPARTRLPEPMPPAASARSAPPPSVGTTSGTLLLVGASTGGPPALDALLTMLPADFPWPIVIAQHMPASFTRALAQRLDRICALQVSEVTEAASLRAGCVYIAKGDADIVVGRRAGTLLANSVAASTEHRWHPSVDRLVDSAMAHVDATRLVGVLMTGMGNDGAAAMTRLHVGGGRTVAESEETAVIWGMPGELVKAGGAGVVAPLGRIADQLLSWTA